MGVNPDDRLGVVRLQLLGHRLELGERYPASLDELQQPAKICGDQVREPTFNRRSDEASWPARGHGEP